MDALKIKKIGIDTYKENVAYMPAGCEICKSQGFDAQSKIEIHYNERSILAILNMTENGLVQTGEIGLSDAAFRHLGAPEGAGVRLSHPNPLSSTDLIRNKLDGDSLTKEHFLAIIRDVLAFRYSNIELTAFVIACSKQHLNEEEILYLTEAMIETGERINWGLPLVLDKHCIGGVPGNRTTMIVVPIIAAFGLPIPKTSSRAITSPSGTADAMETVANVQLSLEQMKSLVHQEKACIAWGGSLYLAPVDDILISVERPLNLDSEGQMVASILSKKRAAGSNRLILDIPVGIHTKARSQEDGRRLTRLFEQIGEKIGMKVRAVLTDGSQPVGRGIGPYLEAQDVLQILRREPEAPLDLREKSLLLAGELLEFSGEVEKCKGKAMAQEILDSGKALKKFQRIVEKQGGQKKLSAAPFQADQISPAAGKVISIHNQKIAKVAKLAGAPQDSRAGVYLHAKMGDKVQKGQAIYTIFAETEEQLRFSIQYAQANPDTVVVEA
jgi:putative thymidine phosphorylase